MTAEELQEPLAGLLEAALAGGEPDPEACEVLADQLLAIGAGAAAARWRSWALLPPAAEHLRRELSEARRLLAGEEAAAPPLPPAWQELMQRLQAGAPAEELSALVRGLRDQPQPQRAQRLELSQQVQRAGAPQAALALLDPLMPEAIEDADLAQRLAELQRQCGNPRQAELWSRLSLRQRPQQPLLWFLLARTLLDQEVCEEALQCAETGLRQAPRHPWGLKLRLNSLAAMGGWHSVDQLLQAGEIPADPAFVSGLEAQRSRYRRRARLGATAPGPLGLDERLRLRGVLRERPAPVAVLHGRSGAALLWLQQQGVWSEAPEVLPLASRDPLRLAASLREGGFRLAPEQPLSALAQLPPPALLVIERPLGRRLPLPLAAALQWPALLLAPAGLLQLPQRRLGRHGGWELFGAADAGG